MFMLKNQIYKKAARVFNDLKPRIEELMPFIEPKDDSKNTRTLKILILERGFDIVSPLIHDFYYEGLIRDFLDIDVNNITIKKKNYKIDYKDGVYKKFKYCFINEAMNGMNSDFKNFMKNNATARA